MPDAESVVDCSWLAPRMRDGDVRVVEIDVSGAAFEEGHIPGAVLWNAYGDLRNAGYMPISPSGLQQLLVRSGVTPETSLVFCGYGAALGYWLMRAHGHRDARMLAGTREQWARAFGGLSSDEPEPAPGDYPIRPADSRLLATRADVEAAIGDPGCVLLDVRSQSEYDGERFWPSGATADAGTPGRIPGAVSLPIDRLRADGDELRPVDEMRRAFEEAGVRSDRRVIVYCTIGNRASQAWYALHELLGYADASVYYASWVEWGKTPDLPVETASA
jgi:thiosulfate/3-mercaptopyruvate sulfurtransferase